MNYYKAINAIRRHAVLRNGDTCGIAYEPETSHAVMVADCGCWTQWGVRYTDECSMLNCFDTCRALNFPEIARAASVEEIARFNAAVGRHRGYGIDDHGQPFAYDTEPLPAL